MVELPRVADKITVGLVGMDGLPWRLCCGELGVWDGEWEHLSVECVRISIKYLGRRMRGFRI